MLRYFFIGLFSCWSCTSILAQAIAPGGVKGFISWYQTEEHSSQERLNFNPAQPFPSPDDIHIPLNALNSDHSLSIFSVYQAQEGQQEMSIWSLLEGANTKLLLSSHRLADLAERRYMNFNEIQPWQAHINSYFQHKSAEQGQNGSYQLSLANRPQDYDLPIQSFRGVIPEVIVYDRVLSPKERLQVTSYLAIKYGLSIENIENSAYLNGSGDTLWLGRQNREYNHRITGIADDPASDLKQYKSSSSYDPKLLTISWEEANNVSPNSFVLWGDNDQSLDWEDSPQTIKPLERQWRIRSNGVSSPSSLQFYTRQLYQPVKNGETYWLLIDRSGTGQFQEAETDYIPLDQLNEEGYALFNQINWDRDGSGFDNFSIGIGPCPDCEWPWEISNASQNGAFIRALLSPNPSPDGYFNLEVLLDKQADLSLHLWSSDGQLLLHKQWQGHDYYQYQGQLKAKGSYILELRSGQSQITKRLLIQ